MLFAGHPKSTRFHLKTSIFQNFPGGACHQTTLKFSKTFLQANETRLDLMWQLTHKTVWCLPGSADPSEMRMVNYYTGDLQLLMSMYYISHLYHITHDLFTPFSTVAEDS